MSTTTSLCPVCLALLPARILATPRGVVLVRACPSHGRFETLIAADSDVYAATRGIPRKVKKPRSCRGVVDRGCPEDCGLCSAHEQHTCLAIVEITSRCDLGCPVCLASSGPQGEDWDAATLTGALKTLLRCEGGPAPLQISGGEPTLHPDLRGMVRSARALGFHKIEVDTNGLALARDPCLCDDLREAGLSGVYLSLDGLAPAVSLALRGRDLVDDKLRAIENARAAGLDVVLAVTVVPGVNDEAMWEMIQFGVKQRLTGVNFQPMARTGRFPDSAGNARERLDVSHFIRLLERQSNRQLSAGDVNPIPCPDPVCGAMAYLVVDGGRLVPGSRLIPKERLGEYTADGSDWCRVLADLGIDEATGCGCPPADLTLRLETGERRLPDDVEFFAVGFHGMMDAHSFDLSRARRCCVHELTREGKLIPFCLYNIKHRGRGPRPHS